MFKWAFRIVSQTFCFGSNDKDLFNDHIYPCVLKSVLFCQVITIMTFVLFLISLTLAVRPTSR
jgi:hypothetical protein